MKYIKAYNAEPEYSLSQEPTVFPKAIIENSSFGKYTEIRDFANVSNSVMDDYSYVSEYTQITNTKVGKFVNIASNCRINPGFHPYEMPCQHHMLYRKSLYGFGQNDKAFFNYRKVQEVSIGHDVWI